jgi:hypothetical protein
VGDSANRGPEESIEGGRRPTGGDPTGGADFYVAYRYRVDDPKGTFTPTVYNVRKGQYPPEVCEAVFRWVTDIAANHKGSRAGVMPVSISTVARGTSLETQELDAAIARLKNGLRATGIDGWPSPLSAGSDDGGRRPAGAATSGVGNGPSGADLTGGLEGTVWVVKEDDSKHAELWFFLPRGVLKSELVLLDESGNVTRRQVLEGGTWSQNRRQLLEGGTWSQNGESVQVVTGGKYLRSAYFGVSLRGRMVGTARNGAGSRWTWYASMR